MLASWTVPVMSIVRRWLMDFCLGVDMCCAKSASGWQMV